MLTESPAASQPRTSRGGPVISSQALAQPSLASSLETRLTATASISCLVTILMRSRTSPVISAELRTSLLDSVSTTVRKTGGTGQSSSAVVTTPSTKDTGATLRLVLSKSLALPSAVRCPTTPRHRSPGSSRRLNNQTPKRSSTRSAESSRSSVSASYAAPRRSLEGNLFPRTLTPPSSRSLSPSGTFMPKPASSGTSSSCWKVPASSGNGPTRGVLRAPVASTNPTEHDTPSLLMTGVSPSMVSPARSHGTSLSPHHPLPGLLPPVALATVVLPGSGQGAPMVTGRIGIWTPVPPPQKILSTPDESVLP